MYVATYAYLVVQLWRTSWNSEMWATLSLQTAASPNEPAAFNVPSLEACVCLSEPAEFDAFRWQPRLHLDFFLYFDGVQHNFSYRLHRGPPVSTCSSRSDMNTFMPSAEVRTWVYVWRMWISLKRGSTSLICTWIALKLHAPWPPSAAHALLVP